MSTWSLSPKIHSTLFLNFHWGHRARSGIAVLTYLLGFRGFPGGASGKEPTCQCRRQKRHRFNPWVWKVPWRRAWQPTPVFLPGEFQKQRSLAGSSPWGSHRVGHSWSDLSMHAGRWKYWWGGRERLGDFRCSYSWMKFIAYKLAKP